MVRPEKQQGCAHMLLTLCCTENSIRQTWHYDAIWWKCRTVFMCVLTGLWEATAEPWMCCLLIMPIKATSELFPSVAHFCPVGLSVSNNTITQKYTPVIYRSGNSVPSIVVSSPWVQKLWFWNILEYLHETHLPPQPLPLQYAECCGMWGIWSSATLGRFARTHGLQTRIIISWTLPFLLQDQILQDAKPTPEKSLRPSWRGSRTSKIHTEDQVSIPRHSLQHTPEGLKAKSFSLLLSYGTTKNGETSAWHGYQVWRPEAAEKGQVLADQQPLTYFAG